jgi:ribose transport system substrate-binding protein
MRDKSLLAMLCMALGAALAIFILFRVDAAPKRPEREVVAILKAAGPTNAFWSSVVDGLESGAQDFGFALTTKAPRDETLVDEQIDLVLKTIEERPAAIVLAAADYRLLVDPVRQAKKRGIKVVCVDSFIDSRDADASVGTDNFEAGLKCGKALLRLLKSGSRIAAMSYVKGSSTAIGRESGLMKALEGWTGPIETSYSSSDSGTAYAQAKAALEGLEKRTDGSLLGIVALNLPTLQGAARALDESGMKERVILVGVDSSADIVKYIERGVVRDAIVQKPFNMGYLAMATVRDLFSGKRPKSMINTGSVDVDKRSMFEPENEKLLFPVGGQ